MGSHTSFGVALEAQHNLWCSVPSSRDVLGHVASILLRVDGETSRQTEIANLELAVGINEQVTRLQISVKHVGGVDILETAKNLVDEGLEVSIGKRLTGSDNSRQIALHQLCRFSVSLCSTWRAIGVSVTDPHTSMSR